MALAQLLDLSALVLGLYSAGFLLLSFGLQFVSKAFLVSEEPIAEKG